MKKILLTLSGISVLPVLALADNGIEELINTLGELIQSASTVIFALAALVFFWSLITYLWGAEEKKEGATKGITLSIVVLFIMFSIWGIIQILQETVDVDGDDSIDVPEFPALKS